MSFPGVEYWNHPNVKRAREINQIFNDARAKLLEGIAEKNYQELEKRQAEIEKKQMEIERIKQAKRDWVQVDYDFSKSVVITPGKSAPPPVTVTPPRSEADKEQEAWDWMARRVRG